MITAKQARMLGYNTKPDTLEEAEIEKRIKIAAKSTNQVFWYKRLSVAMKRTLEQNGFTVSEYNDQRDGYIATITW